MLSSKDHPNLIIGAVQLVELLLSEVPEGFRPAFRREGVFYEVELLAERPIVSSKKRGGSSDKTKEPYVMLHRRPTFLHSLPFRFLLRSLPAFPKEVGTTVAGPPKT